MRIPAAGSRRVSPSLHLNVSSSTERETSDDNGIEGPSQRLTKLFEAEVHREPPAVYICEDCSACFWDRLSDDSVDSIVPGDSLQNLVQIGQ